MHLNVNKDYRLGLFLLGFTAIVSVVANRASGADDVAAGMITLNDNGGWSCFEDERAIVDAAHNQLLVSSVDNGSGTGGAERSGDIDVATLNLADMTVERFVLQPSLAADDHSSAAIIVRPDGRYLAMYGTHAAGGEAGQRWRDRLSTDTGAGPGWE